MKLCAKLKEGRRVRRIYDTAKTPLMRLLQVEALSAEHERALVKQFEDLDPVRVLEQAQQAQQTLFCDVVSVFVQSEKRRRLCGSERFRVVGKSLVPSAADAVSRRETGTGREEEEPSATTSLLEWHRTCNDPFQEQWEVIAEWVRADPTRSCRAMFEELRRLSPDRYQPSHLRTLQRGVCKIRARLAHVSVQSQKDVSDETVSTILASKEHELQHENTQDAKVSALLVSEEYEPHDEANEQAETASVGSCARVSAHTPSFSSSFEGQGEPGSVQEPSFERAPLEPSEAKQEHVSETSLMSDSSAASIRAVKNPLSITIEEAVEEYLAAQQQVKRRPKTMEWHQTALRLFEQYLRTECQVILLAEMTKRHVHGWVESLRVPIVVGRERSTGTRHSYTRSARAWCQWLVNAGLLRRTPFAEIALVRVEPAVMHPLEAEEWERLLQACESPGEHGVIPEWAPARNRALLWVLYDTGMRLAEVCALRLGDVDLEQGMLTVRRDTFKGRRLPLGHEALEAVRVYVKQHRVSGRRASVEQGGISGKPLFLSETGHGLTENGIVSMFGRLRERAGLKREEIGPTLLRDSFAVRYVQVGGDVFTLRDLLGYRESAAVKRYLRMSDGGSKKHIQMEDEETQLH